MKLRGHYAAAMPLGLCVPCLRALVRDEPNDNAVLAPLPDGSTLWAVYCPHNAVGAHCVVSEHRPPKWVIEGPVSLREFSEQMQSLPAAMIGTGSAVMDAATSSASSGRVN